MIDLLEAITVFKEAEEEDEAEVEDVDADCANSRSFSLSSGEVSRNDIVTLYTERDSC